MSIAAAVVAIAVTVDMPLWARWALAVAGPFITLFLLTLIGGPLGRLCRFITALPNPGPPFGELSFGGHVVSQVTRAGADPDDLNASRVVSEQPDGSCHVEIVLPVGEDPIPEMRRFVDGLRVPVKSVRAMRGQLEVDRWKPGLWQRLKWAWRVAADEGSK